MNILIGIPTSSHVNVKFVKSLSDLLVYTKNQGHKVATVFMEGVRTDKNRNIIIKKFMEGDFEALQFLDSDMVYPKEMIQMYIDSGRELIGGVYFKRTSPHYPVLYNYKDGHFVMADLTDYVSSEIIEIGGLGTGGMFIRKGVFKTIESSGRDYWFKYGDNYHLPHHTDKSLTHDLEFCRTAIESGIQPYLHTGVTMGHISDDVVGTNHWLADREYKKNQDRVQVNISAYGVDAKDKLYKAIEAIGNNTKYPNYQLVVAIDGDPELRDIVMQDYLRFPNVKFVYSEENRGYGQTINELINTSEADYHVYLAQDVIMGEGWLIRLMTTYKEVFPDLDGLVTFDKRWFEEWRDQDRIIATHGLVHKNILKYTGETLFYSGYKHYNVDRELTEVIGREDKLVYVEVPYEHLQAKAGKSEPDKSLQKGLSTATEDWNLFLQRKSQGFPKH